MRMLCPAHHSTSPGLPTSRGWVETSTRLARRSPLRSTDSPASPAASSASGVMRRAREWRSRNAGVPSARMANEPPSLAHTSASAAAVERAAGHVSPAQGNTDCPSSKSTPVRRSESAVSTPSLPVSGWPSRQRSARPTGTMLAAMSRATSSPGVTSSSSGNAPTGTRCSAAMSSTQVTRTTSPALPATCPARIVSTRPPNSG